jgi:hypothetical protein
MFKPVSLDIARLDLPAISPTCPTSRFALESISPRTPLHLPPPLLTYEFSDSKSGFVGIPSTFLIIGVNRRAQPISQVLVSASIEAESMSETFMSPTYPTLEPSRSVTFPLVSLAIHQAGPVTIHATFEYTFDNARARVKVKETFAYENPLDVVTRIHPADIPIYEVRVSNTKLQKRILNVRATVDKDLFPIAKSLGPDEAGSGFVVLCNPPRQIKLHWDIPGCEGCYQPVPLPDKEDAVEAPIRITLGPLKRVISCLEPFMTKILVENRGKTELSGELTIRNGPVALAGLNSLQFRNIPPGQFGTLEGSFIALEEGHLAFPAFQVAIKEGPQFEVDVEVGIFVVGSIV